MLFVSEMRIRLFLTATSTNSRSNARIGISVWEEAYLAPIPSFLSGIIDAKIIVEILLWIGIGFFHL